MRKTPLTLECLESRLTPSASARLDQFGNLLAFDFANGAKSVVVQSAGPGAVSVSFEGGAAQTFSGVKNVSITTGGTGPTSVYQGTTITAQIRASVGDASDLSVVSKSAGTINASGGGGGRVVVQDLAGASTLNVKTPGFASVYGGKGDAISVKGGGQTEVYDILAAASLSVDAHAAHDYLLVGAGTAVTGANAADDLVRFFAANRLPGSGTLVYDAATQTVYFTADNAGDRAYFHYDAAGMLDVDYTTAAGSFSQTFDPSTVRDIAAFGGAGNDVFYNATSIDSIMYGQGGANSLIELPDPGVARPQFSLMKAGGAAQGTNYLVSDAVFLNDLNGSATPGAMTYAYAPADAALNIFRSNFPASDYVYGLRPTDLYVGPPTPAVNRLY